MPSGYSLSSFCRYTTFGSVAKGRSFSSQAYRYGYQGSEKDDEIAAAGNDYTTHYRAIDTRLGRWFSLDPINKSYESQYSSISNNPIRDFDKLGDDLDAGNNKESKSDVKSLAKNKNQDYIKIDDKTGKVTLDFGTKTKDEVSKILKKDEGLNLINDLVKSDKKFLYEATDIFLGKNGDGMKFGRPLYLENDKIINASDNGTDSNNGHTFLPKEGYNGQVAIHKDATYEEESGSGMIVKKSRSTVVFHELAESYERTNNGVSYKGDAKGKGAHQLSIDRENAWWNTSSEPGAIRNPYAPTPP
uniref:RHS repeat-associated core domain-containing protein n=1 Tax=Sphingomonas sp. TaxID=28214 RepID=UPI0025ED8C33